MLDAPKNAVSPVDGTMAGVQLAAVLKSPEPGLASHVTSAAPAGGAAAISAEEASSAARHAAPRTRRVVRVDLSRPVTASGCVTSPPVAPSVPGAPSRLSHLHARNKESDVTASVAGSAGEGFHARCVREVTARSWTWGRQRPVVCRLLICCAPAPTPICEVIE